MNKGTVIKSTGSRYTVRLEDGQTVNCGIRGKFRIKGIRATNPVAVGDRVGVEWTQEGKACIITSIETRSNYIIRKASKLSKSYQLIACNVDLAWLMISLVLPKTLTGFIDRFLVSAEAYRIPVILLFNKTDLYGEKELAEMNELWSIYSGAGYRCMAISVKAQEGIDRVGREMEGKVNVIAGNSGVGKSALINALDPSVAVRIGKISEYHRSGTHTTTFAEMFELKGDIRIIDTPGIKGFGTIDIERTELFHFFPEIFRASQQCKYHNCLHVNEPGCGVKEALSKGEISESRYVNYLVMLEEEPGKYR